MGDGCGHRIVQTSRIPDAGWRVDTAVWLCMRVFPLSTLAGQRLVVCISEPPQCAMRIEMLPSISYHVVDTALLAHRAPRTSN